MVEIYSYLSPYLIVETKKEVIVIHTYANQKDLKREFSLCTRILMNKNKKVENKVIISCVFSGLSFVFLDANKLLVPEFIKFSKVEMANIVNFIPWECLDKGVKTVEIAIFSHYKSQELLDKSVVNFHRFFTISHVNQMRAEEVSIISSRKDSPIAVEDVTGASKNKVTNLVQVLMFQELQQNSKVIILINRLVEIMVLNKQHRLGYFPLSIFFTKREHPRVHAHTKLKPTIIHTHLQRRNTTKAMAHNRKPSKIKIPNSNAFQNLPLPFQNLINHQSHLINPMIQLSIPKLKLSQPLTLSLCQRLINHPTAILSLMHTSRPIRMLQIKHHTITKRQRRRLAQIRIISETTKHTM
mmetsp:Transcript_50957/g.58438  ORF Transcript_50957/g.58438 Transcript_50957/m.58438 type:complete len:355 (-) Transcript_50957:676-1740(-)